MRTQEKRGEEVMDAPVVPLGKRAHHVVSGGKTFDVVPAPHGGSDVRVDGKTVAHVAQYEDVYGILVYPTGRLESGTDWKELVTTHCA